MVLSCFVGFHFGAKKPPLLRSLEFPQFGTRSIGAILCKKEQSSLWIGPLPSEAGKKLTRCRDTAANLRYHEKCRSGLRQQRISSTLKVLLAESSHLTRYRLLQLRFKF